MFDTFEPFQRVTMGDFSFHPLRFEIWKGGERVADGSTREPIIARRVYSQGLKRMLISIEDSSLYAEISDEHEFDLFITSTDRLQLVTVPEFTVNENTALSMFKMVIGPTREERHFKSNEPFCCNLFLVNGEVEKVTFTFNNPE